MRDSNANKNLPWWVELLFVQIGLPDYWLRSFLKARKRSKIFFKENRNTIGITTLLILTLAYFYPMIRLSSLHNECINNSKSYVRSKIGEKELLSDKEIKAIIINFCNGGFI